MAQKKIKKVKNAKAKKPAKPLKKKAGSSVLRAAAKAVGKKIGAALRNGAKGKAAARPAKALKKTAKEKKSPPKGSAGKKALPVKKAGAPKKVAPPAKASKVKAKGPSKVPAPNGKPGKKKPEVVLEVPAPKGVALLGREGKKKGRSSEASVPGKKRCREPGCEHELLLSGYCRLHYIKNWRKIKRKEAILASGQLNNYVEELVNKYPDKYLDVIRQDLASEKDWAKVVVDLELESADDEAAGDEDLEGVAEGVRREREFDDDSESF
jgi:hypothetical protein